MKRHLLISLLILALVYSCTDSKKDVRPSDMEKGELIADTIFYPVRIKNIDPSDEWADVRLKNLNKKGLVDELFESVYSGKSVAYNYLTDEPYSIDQVKAIETNDDYSRDNIVELEFREKWWYNKDKSTFEKEILSILVAYAVFDTDGEFSRMKAAFYVKMN